MADVQPSLTLTTSGVPLPSLRFVFGQATHYAWLDMQFKEFRQPPRDVLRSSDSGSDSARRSSCSAVSACGDA